MTYREVVCERSSWLNGTLAHAGNTIHFCRPILVNTVEMQTRGLVAELVEYIDHNAVSDSCSDVWYRPLAIDSDERSVEKAIRVGGNPSDVKVIRDCGRVG